MKSDVIWNEMILTPQSFPVCIRGEDASSAKTKYDLFLNEIPSPVVGPNVACRNTVHELPVRLTSLYIRIPKTPRTEPGKNDLHYCQRTTASGDCRLRPAEAERSWFGNAIFGWAVRVYVSKRKTRTANLESLPGRSGTTLLYIKSTGFRSD